MVRKHNPIAVVSNPRRKRRADAAPNGALNVSVCVSTKMPRRRRSRCPGLRNRPKERTVGLWRGRRWLLVSQPA